MIRDIRTVMNGALAAQALGFLVLPLLTRLFDPAAFGHFAAYQAVLLILSVCACLRFDQAILVAGSEREAVGLFQLCAVVAAFVSFIVFVVAVLAPFIGLKGSSYGGLSLFWLVPATWLAGMALAGSATLTRLGAFSVSAWSRTWQAVANAATSVGSGLIAPVAGGLIAADLFGKLAALPSVLWRLRTGGADGLTRPKPRDLIALAKRFRKFPQLSVLGGLLNNGGTFMAPALMFVMFGATTAGQYALVDRAISLPLGLILLAVSQVFSSHFARFLRENPRGALPYLMRLVRNTALLGLVPGIVGAIAAPYLFSLVFGAEWAVAGQYAQILALAYYSSLIMGPINTALVVLERQQWQLGWEGGRLVLIAAAWGSAFWLNLSPSLALGAFSIATVVANGAFVLIVLDQLKKHIRVTASAALAEELS